MSFRKKNWTNDRVENLVELKEKTSLQSVLNGNLPLHLGKSFRGGGGGGHSKFHNWFWKLCYKTCVPVPQVKIFKV